MQKESDYRDEIEEFVSLASSIDEVVYIYQYGSVNSLGLSDIDIFLVTKDTISPEGAHLVSNLCSIYNQHDKFDICSYKILPLSLFKRVNQLGKVELKLLYGGVKLELESFDPVTKHIEVFDILDWLPERINNIESTIQSNSIDIVKLMGDLYSMAHSLRRLSNFYQNKRLKTYLKDIDTLRKNWFDRSESDAAKELYKLSIYGINLSKGQLVSFVDFLHDNKVVNSFENPIKKNEKFYFSPDRYMYFDDDIDNAFSMPSFIKEYIKLQMSSYSGELKSTLGKCAKFDAFQATISFNDEYLNVHNDRCSLASDIYSFVLGNKIGKRRLYRFGHLHF